MKDTIIPKAYIAKQIAENIASDNPISIKEVIENGGVMDTPKTRLIQHIEHRYLPALRIEFEKQGLTPDKIKILLNERYSNIHDIAMDKEEDKSNIDLTAAKNALDGLAKLNQLIKDTNINIANITIDEKKELYNFLREKIKNEDTDKDVQVVKEIQSQESLEEGTEGISPKA